MKCIFGFGQSQGRFVNQPTRAAIRKAAIVDQLAGRVDQKRVDAVRSRRKMRAIWQKSTRKCLLFAQDRGKMRAFSAKLVQFSRIFAQFSQIFAQL